MKITLKQYAEIFESLGFTVQYTRGKIKIKMPRNRYYEITTRKQAFEFLMEV